jgi:hypothetical protein
MLRALIFKDVTPKHILPKYTVVIALRNLCKTYLSPTAKPLKYTHSLIDTCLGLRRGIKPI